MVPLSDDARCRAKGWPEPPDRYRRLRTFCDAYGLEPGARQGFTQLAMRMARTCADQVRAAAAEGVPTARWLVEDVGFLHIVQRDIAWMRQSVAAIDGVLS